MLKAHGYTPTIIWIKAGVDIEKHRAVTMTTTGGAIPAQASSASPIGVTMTAVTADSYVAVQVDGVVYEWEGIPDILTPSSAYYQSDDGTLTTTPADPDTVLFGIAIDETTLLLRTGGSGGGGGLSGITDIQKLTFFIYLTAADISNKYVELPTDITKDDIEDIILYGGDIHLKEDIDYIFDLQDSSIMSVIDGSHSADGILDDDGSTMEAICGTPWSLNNPPVKKLYLVWDPATLPSSSVSILERALPRDLITIKCLKVS